jgi:hypothetical protein
MPPLASSRAIERLREAYLEKLRDVGLDLALSDCRPAALEDVFATGHFDPRAVQENLRLLESARGYTAWESVATDPRAVFLERLANVKKRSIPYLGDRLPAAQTIVEGQLAELRTWLAGQGIELPFEIHAGVYPTGALNARAVRVKDVGALLLVNVGLMDLVFTLLKINMAAPPPGTNDGLLTAEQAMLAVAEVFNAYLYGEGSLGAWRLPRLPAEREHMLEFVLRRTEQFVLAHEVGHVALGHLAAGGDDEHEPGHEIAADRFAVDLLVRAYADGPPPKPPASHLAGAAMTFFVVADAVRTLEEALGLSDPAAETHPHLHVRMNHVAGRLRSTLPAPDLLRPSVVFAAWLQSCLPAVREQLVAVGEIMKRGNRWD